MAILINKETRVLCQGMTGASGKFHTEKCAEYGTKMVGGVTPGKGGGTASNLPLFNTVKQAMAETKANATMIFVPPPFAADAILEAIDAKMPLIVAITEGIPVLDMLAVHQALKTGVSRLIGPNCPGVITPGQCKIGIMPGHIHLPGKVGIVSKSGTLTYEAVGQLTALNIGQSSCVGIGGDPIVGTSFIDTLMLFNADPDTELVVLIGEIGGNAEIEAAHWIQQNMKKPVVGFIAGQAAPKDKRMGHAGAIISGGQGTAAEKYKAMAACGIHTVASPGDIGKTVQKVYGK